MNQKFLDKIEEIDPNVLFRLKKAITHAHITYIEGYSTESKTEKRHGLTESELNDFEQSYMYMNVSAAEAVYSDTYGIFDEAPIAECYCEEEQAFYQLYPLSNIWQYIKELDPEKFFIAIVSLALNVDESILGNFYRTKIMSLIKEEELLEILI